MALSIKTKEFLDSPLASEIRKELTRMMNDTGYNTRPKYSALAKGDVLFVDKHINYLSLHLDVNPDQYLSNLRLITKYN
jgi:hypothetical protein